MPIAYSTDETCPECEEGELYYTTQEEANGWKVYLGCDRDDGCGRDFGRVGYISMSDVDSKDEMYDKAEEIAKEQAEYL